ncbi:T9SS type A sorting domain-containing protein [Psychroserpens sp.]
MKRTLLFLAICLCFGFSHSQVELMPNPSNINSGTFTFKYGEFGDYSIFDPLSNPNLYVYTGLQTDANPLTWDFNDGEFLISNLGQMVPLTFDNGLGYYVATFNPKTRLFFEEATQTLTNVPEGIEVFDLYFLITTDDLARQSADLSGSDYGFNAATVLSVDNFSINDDVLVLNGSIKFLKSGQFKIEVFDVLGKKISSESLSVNNKFTHKLKLHAAGIYIVKIISGNTTKVIKMLKH